MIHYFDLNFYCTVNCNHVAQFDCLQSLVFQNKRSQYLKIIPYFMTSARRHKSIYLNETMPNARTKRLPFYCGVAQWTDVCGFPSISFIVQVVKASHLSISLSLSLSISLWISLSIVTLFVNGGPRKPSSWKRLYSKIGRLLIWSTTTTIGKFEVSTLFQQAVINTWIWWIWADR